jgi:hypothetical protein
MQVMLEQKFLGDSMNCKFSEVLIFTLFSCGLRHGAALSVVVTEISSGLLITMETVLVYSFVKLVSSCQVTRCRSSQEIMITDTVMY